MLLLKLSLEIFCIQKFSVVSELRELFSVNFPVSFRPQIVIFSNIIIRSSSRTFACVVCQLNLIIILVYFCDAHVSTIVRSDLKQFSRRENKRRSSFDDFRSINSCQIRQHRGDRRNFLSVTAGESKFMNGFAFQSQELRLPIFEQALPV